MKTFKTWLLTIAVLLCSISASAYDFESGGIYYNITSSDDKTVEVTYGEDDFYYSASITIPESVTYDGAAYSVTSIGNDAFNDCSGLTSINIPTNVTSIGNNAFNGCSGLTSIDIPTNVTSIGKRAFYGCSGLTSIDIPHSVTQIEPEAFSACPDLTFITVSVDNPKYDSRDNSNAIIETSSNTLLSGCKNTVIPISVTNIGDNAFSNCYGLTSIDIPNGVTSIGDFAFYGCTGLTSIVIPSSVTSIGNYAFWDCIFLRVVLNYSSLDIWKGSKENGCVASYAYIVLNNVDGIVDDFVFTENDGQYYLSACLRGDSVLSLPEHYKNKGYGIGDSVFCNRNELIAITIPKGVTSIKSKSFSGCLALTSIDIPHTVMQIEPGAFSDCSGLTSITVSVDNPKYDSRDNSNAIIETSSNTLLSGCKNTVIPASVTNIGDNAFEGCYGLTSIDIPNGVTRIGNNAFSGCYNLTSVTIPASVTSIGEAAFASCYELVIVECHAVTPPSLFSFSGKKDSFRGVDTVTCILKVPEESIAAYQQDWGWMVFSNIESLTTGINDIKQDGGKNAPVYNLNGTRVNNAKNMPKGVYVINGKKVMVK